MSDYYTESQMQRIEQAAYDGATLEAGKEWERQRYEFDATEAKLVARIAELEAEVTKCHELQDSYCDRIAELEAEIAKMKKYFHKPAHGTCCTCQKCGHTYDECRCDFDEALDDLDKANARIAELEAAQRWIPVSERLPEFNRVVAVIDMSDKDSHLCNVYETAILVEVRGDTRFGFIGHSGWDSSDVTHWMPLPKLPEDK